MVDFVTHIKPFLNRARAWFPEIVLRKVCVCVHVCMYVLVLGDSGDIRHITI